MNEISETPFLAVEDVRKSFRIGHASVEVLRGVTFSARRAEWIALLGASGSGKTTLLDILGFLSRPDSGSVRVGGEDPARLSHRALVSFRRKNIGFIFQAYHILPELSVLENVMLPGRLEGMSVSAAKERATSLLERVGLSHRMRHRPGELSGGEQQRTAIARAMMNRPPLILADEPTGNLDSVTGQGILDLFFELRRESSSTVVMVTHDRNVASLADRIVELRDGVAFQQNEQQGGVL